MTASKAKFSYFHQAGLLMLEKNALKFILKMSIKMQIAVLVAIISDVEQ